MDPSSPRLGSVICTGCASPNSHGADFCAACGAPLTWHATTDPVATIFAEGYAARRAVSQPSRPIVVVGVWLWMLPVVAASVVGLTFGLTGLLEGLIKLEFELIVSGLLALGIGTVAMAICGPMLYKSTRNYLRSRGAGRGTQSAEPKVPAGQSTAAAGDVLKCLACGQSIPPDAAKCPVCGWWCDENMSAPPP